MHFKPEINREKICANVYFVLVLEENITAVVLRINSRARTERKDYNQPAFPFGQGAMSLPTEINGFKKCQIKLDKLYFATILDLEPKRTPLTIR